MTSEVRRDVATGLTLALAMASMAMTVIDRTKGGAKSAEELEGRVKTLERVQGEHGAVLRLHSSFAADAREQINHLCTSAAGCRSYFPQPIPKPE